MTFKTRIDINKLLDFSIPESCYILGFLWADSYIYWKVKSVILEIVSSDFYSIQNILNTIGPWTLTHRTRPNRKPQTRAQFNSSQICAFLEQYNYKEKSTASPIILDIIPKETQHYFIRGLFDGDGNFYHNKKLTLRQSSIAGSYTQDWSSIEKILNDLSIDYKVLRRTNKNSTDTNSIIRFCGLDNIFKFGSYIYSGKQFGLFRKYNKYADIINSSIRVNHSFIDYQY